MSFSRFLACSLLANPAGLAMAEDDLQVDVLLEAPLMAQPSFLNFDERGRMWVMQYRQYPFPAGVELVNRDQFWRSTYDRKIPPPGHPDYPRGKDLITIHEDCDGDGTYEHNEVFLDGLNFATSFVRGNKGVWLLQPPYLLFYPENSDGTMSKKPIVHLDGFGIEDSHAIATALTWGPDGWLYGCQGSTVSLDIQGIKRQGQLIWRYHPAKKTFEIFAEGGGNIWSCEFDSVGRLFAGSNNKYVGYWYHQGGYYGKNFGKHGDLSNPHAYGYFDGIPHKKYKRVTTSIMIYEGQSLSDRFHSALMFANPLADGVGAYSLDQQGLSFQAEPLEVINILPREDHFRPVYLDFGPDGAIYVCDWQDTQVNHMKNTIGQISPDDGRIFRIKDKQTSPLKPFDLEKESIGNLLAYLEVPNRWWRETARLVLGHRDDRKEAIPRLTTWLQERHDQLALEALWALHLCEGFNDETFTLALSNRNPHVRRWAIRLAGDQNQFSPTKWQKLQDRLVVEDDLEVLGQIASTAARLPSTQAAPLLQLLLSNNQHYGDRHLTLLTWWAIERHLLEIPDTLVAMMGSRQLIRTNPAWPTLTSFMIRRLASEQSQDHLLRCARLFKLSRPQHPQFLEAFESAYEGRSMQNLPQELLEALGESDKLPLHLQLRLAIKGSQATALKQLESIDRPDNIRLIEYFGETSKAEALPLLLGQLDSKHSEILRHTLSSLQAYPSDQVGLAVLKRFSNLDLELREAASVLLLSRKNWTHQWLQALKSSPQLRKALPETASTSLQASKDPEILRLAQEIWPDHGTATTTNHQNEITRIKKLLTAGQAGDLHRGKDLFTARCASCHQLHGTGGDIGPGLTEYQRENHDTLLQAIVAPDLEIREGFENYLIETKDGRRMSGFLKRNDRQLVVIQPIGGLAIKIPSQEIKSKERVGASLMPAGLLNGLSDQELLDFFAYLGSAQPLPPKR